VFTNTLFRFWDAHGSSFMIRICTPGWRTDTDLQSEVVWLQAINRDTDIGVPQPYSSKDGRFIVLARADGVPEPCRCMVMSWVPGVLLGERLTEENLFKMGVLFAKLHKYATCFIPTPGFTRRKMDRIFARGEEDLLVSEACRKRISSKHIYILDRVRAVVDLAFEQLYGNPVGLRVIHNDLWHGNLKIYRGRLHPLDFEDTIWGYPVQDIAMAFQDLMMDVPPGRFEPLKDAFRFGYESKCEWPEEYGGQIDTFRAGRMLWVANYVARYEPEHLQEHFEWASHLFEEFLATGMLRK